MKNWSERTEKNQSNTAVTAKTMAVGKAATPEAMVLAINPASLPGLGSVGGLSMQLQDMSDHSDIELSEITNKIIAAANQRLELSGVSSTFSITAPSYEYEVNREKAEMLGVNINDVYTALKVNYGGMAADDFNKFGRTYKVMLQSDVYYRSEVETAKFMYVRGSKGQMVPLDTLITPKLNTGAMSINRFNSKRAIAISGHAANGYSSGQAMAAFEEVVKAEAPEGFNIEWSGQSREEKNASGSTGQVLGLALVFVFLCLAALYESWSVPYAVLLTVPTGIFGALLSEYGLSIASAMMGSPNPGLQDSVYMQIGIIIKYQTTAAYYDILRYKDLVATRQESVDLLKQHLYQVETKFDIGVVAKADVLASKVQLANSQQSLVTTQNDYDNAVATLNNIMGLPMDSVLILKDELQYNKYTLDLADCIAYALEHRPNAIAADYAVKQAQANMESTKSSKKPQVNAVVSKTFNGRRPSKTIIMKTGQRGYL